MAHARLPGRDGTVAYYLDGTLIATHGGRFYPRVPMSINYNLWFIAGGLLPGGTTRIYHEEVDWVFQQPGVVLSPPAVVTAVAKLRRVRVAFRDTVPAEQPPLDSACNFLTMPLAIRSPVRTRMVCPSCAVDWSRPLVVGETVNTAAQHDHGTCWPGADELPLRCQSQPGTDPFAPARPCCSNYSRRAA